MTYNVFGGTLNLALSIYLFVIDTLLYKYAVSSLFFPHVSSRSLMSDTFSPLVGTPNCLFPV